MAAATFNIKDQVPQGRQQNSRRVELHYHLDFNTLGDGTGLATTESAEFADLPAGFVYERHDSILRTAEGTAATADFGTEADTDGFNDGADMNGTPNAFVARAGTESIVAGTYFHTTTPVRVTAGAATLDDAIIDVTFVGYMVNTGLEK
jgi:hypothetical protein